MRKKSAKTKKEKEGITDSLYGNEAVADLIQLVMKKGKRSLAQKIVYQALILAKEKVQKEPMEIFDTALKNASPLLEVRSRRVGGATYQVPYEVRGDRKKFLALRWMIQAARAKRGKPIVDKLAEEILAAARNEGEAVRRKENMHRMAEANRAFAHFAW